MRLWSTHNGEQSFFNHLVSGGQPDLAADDRRRGALRLPTGPDSPVTGQRPRVQRVTLLDAVGQGLVERIRGLDHPDPVARATSSPRSASCPDEDAWNEEYLCRPSSEQSSLLSYELIAGCEAANLKLWGVGSGEVGRSGDPTPYLPPPHTPPHFTPASTSGGSTTGRCCGCSSRSGTCCGRGRCT